MSQIDLNNRKIGIAAVNTIKKHLSGERKLNEYQIETCREIIVKNSENFWFFTENILGLNKYPQTHKRWCEKHQADFYSKRNFTRLKPRGTGKTTIYGFADILWIWSTISPEIKIFYVSANSLLLEEVYDSLKRVLSDEYNSLYSFIFDIRLDKNAKNTSEIINITGRGTGKGFSLTMRTSGSSTAGVHPNIIIVDDPCDKNDRTSVATRRDKKIWADTLRPLLHPITVKNMVIKHLMVIATFWHMDDVTHYFMSQNSRLSDEMKFDIEIESLDYPNTGTSNFSEIYKDIEIPDLKANMDALFYSCQYNNIVLPEGTKIFDINKFHFSNLSKIDIKQGSNYCFIDPSKGKVESDFPAVIFVNLQNEKLFIFDAITEIKPFPEVLDNAAAMCKAYNVIKLTFEDNGTNLIEEAMTNRFKNLKHYCEIAGVWEGRNKVERIRNMSPVLFSGDVFFRDDWERVYPELINQIIYFPAWGNDDFPDVVEKAIRDLIKNGADTLSDFVEAFAHY